MRLRNISILMMAILSVFIFMSCRLKVPIREMTNAKNGIYAAQKVKADKYAPDEFELAKKKLIESQVKLVDKDVDNAKKFADESTSLSLAAYNKAIPLLAKDTISIAEKSFGEASDVYAERLATEEYREAEEKLKEANELFQNKKYYDAYEAALKGDERAKNARNIALGKKDVLRDSIVEVKRTIEEAEKYGGKKYTPDKLNLANENVEIADKAYDSHELKKGFSAVEVAKLNADEALLAALKNAAIEKITAAEKTLKQAEKSKLAEQKKNEMNAARESIQNAKSLMESSKYKESIAASDEAIRLAFLAMGKKPDGTDVATENTGSEGTNQQVVEEKDKDKDYDTYKVVWRQKYKDCLWYVSRKFYKNPRLWKKIYNFNKDRIKDPDLIRPGWVLKIPRLKK